MGDGWGVRGGSHPCDSRQESSNAVQMPLPRMTSVPRSGEELRASAGEPRLDRFELSRSGAARRGSGDESAVVIASDAMTSTGKDRSIIDCRDLLRKPTLDPGAIHDNQTLSDQLVPSRKPQFW